MKIETYEQALVLAAKNGNRTSFDELYRIHSPKIYSQILKHVEDPEKAQTLLQETFAAAQSGLSGLDDLNAFVPWTEQIASDLCQRMLLSKESTGTGERLVPSQITMTPQHDTPVFKSVPHDPGISKAVLQNPSAPQFAQQIDRPVSGMQNAVRVGLENSHAAKAGIPGQQVSASVNHSPSGMQQAVRMSLQDTGSASAGGSSASSQIQISTPAPEGIQDAVRSGMQDITGASAGPTSPSTGNSVHPEPVYHAKNLIKGTRQAAKIGADTGASVAVKSAAGAFGKASDLKLAAIITGAVLAAGSSTAGAVSLARNVLDSTSENRTPDPEVPAVVETFDTQPSQVPEPSATQTPAPLEPVTLPVEAEDFLFQYIAYFQYGGNAEYDSQNAEQGSSNILYEIAADNLVHLGTYSRTGEETIQIHMSESDPRSWWDDTGGYQTVDGPTVDWVAENIFHVPHDDIAQLLELAEENRSMYREDTPGGYVYCTPPFWGYGVQNTIDIDDAKTDGTKYYVVYSLYYDLSFFYPEVESERTYLNTYYAVLEPVTIDGTEYWTMYLNPADIPDQE